jgi:hypothetical protein
MAYEEGMSFELHDITGHVTVIFRGKKVKLSSTFTDYRRAREAAEEYCRKNGWKG